MKKATAVKKMFRVMNGIVSQILGMALTASTCLALEGTYEVPVESSAALNSVAGIELVKDANGVTRLYYSLPEDLVGLQSRRIKMRLELEEQGANGRVFKFRGKGSLASCEEAVSGLSLKCSVRYEKLGIDEHERDSFLNQKFSGRPDILNQKLMVAAKFAHDPIGVLTILCSSKNCGL